MIILVGIIVSIFLFSAIILIHEFGHFQTARWFKVRVEEFGLGLPPKAKKIFTDKKGTEYTLNWLPLGGFVRLKGESIHTFDVYDEQKKLYNNETLEKALKENEKIFDRDGIEVKESDRKIILQKLEDNNAKDSLLTKSYWQQAIIILAGVFMNFVLAAVIFSVLFFIGISPVGINNKIETNQKIKLLPTPTEAIDNGMALKGVIITGVLEKGIAETAGIKKLDFIQKIDGIEINKREELQKMVKNSAEKTLNIEVRRYEEKCNFQKDICNFEIKNISITPNKDGIIQVYLGDVVLDPNFRYQYGFFGSIKNGIIETYGQIIFTFQGIKMFAQMIFFPTTPVERQEAINQISGPIGIVHFMTKLVSMLQFLYSDIAVLFVIGAVLSINLGVFNLLPIPALDGGRFLFIMINSIIKNIFGKKAINEQLEGSLHVIFFIIFIALSVLIAYNDIHKIITN